MLNPVTALSHVPGLVSERPHRGERGPGCAGVAWLQGPLSRQRLSPTSCAPVPPLGAGVLMFARRVSVNVNDCKAQRDLLCDVELSYELNFSYTNLST